MTDEEINWYIDNKQNEENFVEHIGDRPQRLANGHPYAENQAGQQRKCGKTEYSG